MNSRQRGALWILVALVAGRSLDRLDLPFEHRDPVPVHATIDSTLAVAPPLAADSTLQRPAPRAATAASAEAPLQINRASAADLQRLPGVGPVLASRIVAQRDAQGPFHSLEDLARVRGLGPKTCARLAPHIRFD